MHGMSENDFQVLIGPKKMSGRQNNSIASYQNIAPASLNLFCSNIMMVLLHDCILASETKLYIFLTLAGLRGRRMSEDWTEKFTWRSQQERKIYQGTKKRNNSIYLRFAMFLMVLIMFDLVSATVADMTPRCTIKEINIKRTAVSQLNVGRHVTTV